MIDDQPFDLAGRCAVVVGGTSGLGREIALGLARAGANVVASSRRSEQVEEVAAAIEAEGRRTLRLCSDVLQRESRWRRCMRACSRSLAAWRSW